MKTFFEIKHEFYLLNIEFLRKLFPETLTVNYYWDKKYILEVNSNIFNGFPLVEKNANVLLLSFPDNIWSIMTFANLFFYCLILILLLPLFFCFITLIFLLKNYLRIFYLGKINSFEIKNINFTIFTKDHWRVLWSYGFDLVPRYTKFEPFKSFPKDFYRNTIKYPNPRSMLAFF